MSQLDIRIGTLAKIDTAPEYIKQIMHHGFESYELTGGGSEMQTMDQFDRIAKSTLDLLGSTATISSIGYYANPLTKQSDADLFAKYIDSAHLFGTNIVGGFTGSLDGRPIPENIPVFKKVWSELAKRAEDKGVKIAFENCDYDGWYHATRWNIMHSPAVWEILFNEVPSDAIGLEWEPRHQMASLVDPIPNLRKWVSKIYHVHGKDGTIAWDVIKEFGIRSGRDYIWHRTPGFGDTNWTDIISILRMAKWEGAIDIEGWHDPVYRGDLEMTGQVHALNYLKNCRGGPYIENPTP